jgi:NADH dehydrogenase
MIKPRILILGAGFGGMFVAKRLVRYAKRGEIDLTIVNRTNYFLFTPLLHEVATGGLNPRTVAEPLREVFKNTGVHIAQGTVEYIDMEKRSVGIRANDHSCALGYDYLVIATGAETNYYNIPGAEKFVLPLKSLSDAARIRNAVIDAFEQAVLIADQGERVRKLSFAVVGGGPTGVETAAELAEFISGMVKRYYHDTDCMPGDAGTCHPEEPMITLVHTGKELLEQFKPSLRNAAARRLMHNGVVLQMNSMVTSVSKDGLTLAGNMTVPASTVIWAAGVKSSIPHFEGKAPALYAGRLAVDASFRLADEDRVFVLGDAAAYIDEDNPNAGSKGPTPLPMLAQVAEGEAKTLARNIIASIKGKQLKAFHYHSKGSMVSVGQWFAVGEIFSLDIAGRLTWWLWRTVYLFKFASWQKRIKIAFEWTLALFYPRDITKLT